MAAEYGVFEDGACIEAGFHGEIGKAAAEAHMADLIAAAPGMADAYEVAEICPDHEEQPKDGCEECTNEGCADCGAENDGSWSIGSDVCGPCWDRAEEDEDC